MADYNSGLPIRSEADGADERVHVKVVDGATPSQRMAVDTDLNAHVESHGNDPTGADKVLRLSELGAVTPDGVYDAANNTKPGTTALIGHTRAATPAETDQVERLTAKAGTVDTTVHALDVSMHDQNGNAFTSSNPLYVSNVAAAGTSINNYNTSAALAAGASNNHDYTVTALMTLKLARIWASASGKLKIQVEVETGVATGTFNTFFVGFNSTANPNIEIEIDQNITVAAGVRVRVVRTNKDNQAQDVYSTISGIES